MLDVTLSILALIAGGVTMELFTVARAPLGRRDEAGLAWGTEASVVAEDLQTGNPS